MISSEKDLTVKEYTGFEQKMPHSTIYIPLLRPFFQVIFEIFDIFNRISEK